MSPRHPPMVPEVGPPSWGLLSAYPLATPAINVGPNEQKSDLRAGRGATATDCALLNIAGWGHGGLGVPAFSSHLWTPSWSHLPIAQGV